jgi:hypothetical protein
MQARITIIFNFLISYCNHSLGTMASLSKTIVNYKSDYQLITIFPESLESIWYCYINKCAQTGQKQHLCPTFWYQKKYNWLIQTRLANLHPHTHTFTKHNTNSPAKVVISRDVLKK